MLWPMSLRDKSASRARFPDWAKRVGRGRPVASRSRVEAPSAVAGSRARPGRTSRPEKTSLGDSQGGGPPPESTGEELPGRARFCWPARPPRPRDGAAGAGDAACHATIAPPPQRSSAASKRRENSFLLLQSPSGKMVVFKHALKTRVPTTQTFGNRMRTGVQTTNRQHSQVATTPGKCKSWGKARSGFLSAAKLLLCWCAVG